MTYTRRQKQEAYRKLSPKVQNFIMDEDTIELIENCLNETGFTEEQIDLADNEITYAMYGLQTLNESMDNIAKMGGVNVEDLFKLRNDLEGNIFSRIIEVKKPTPIEIDKNTEGRIVEVAKKYSLNESQTSKLKDVLSITPADTLDSNILLGNIVSNLSVSKLIAEQIVEDLNKRVLNNERATKSLNNTPRPIVTPKASVPEIRPDNTPMVEDNKVSVPRFMPAGLSPKIEPAEAPTQKPEAQYFTTSPKVETKVESVQNTINQSSLSRINFGKTETVSPSVQPPTPEPVQTPAFVPRFGSTSFNDPLASQPPQGSQSVIENKLNGTTSSQMEKPKPSAPAHEYVVDPYREPLA